MGNISDNQWAVAVLAELKPDFYGELRFTVKAGLVRQVAVTQTFLCPDFEKRDSQGETGKPGHLAL